MGATTLLRRGAAACTTLFPLFHFSFFSPHLPSPTTRPPDPLSFLMVVGGMERASCLVIRVDRVRPRGVARQHAQLLAAPPEHHGDAVRFSLPFSPLPFPPPLPSCCFAPPPMVCGDGRLVRWCSYERMSD